MTDRRVLLVPGPAHISAGLHYFSSLYEVESWCDEKGKPYSNGKLAPYFGSAVEIWGARDNQISATPVINELLRLDCAVKFVDMQNIALDLPTAMTIATDSQILWDLKQRKLREITEPIKDRFAFYSPSLEWAKDIPPRPFLYRRHYMRGMVSLTAAAGGAGKSSVVLVELISAAIGFDLLNKFEPLRVGRMKVWYHNGEDPADEIRRRVAAICKHYEIDPTLLEQNFYYTVGRDNPIIVARELQSGTAHEPKTIEEVTQSIKDKGIDILAIDPFVSTHRVPENSNDGMEVVMSQWRQIADDTDAAIEAVHHFRKSNGNEASVDDIRGASALIGAARSARIFATMSKEEAGKCGIEVDQRRRFLWEGQAKANMYVATDRRVWREMVSIDLGNASGPYESDKVGVATQWEYPQELNAITDELFPVIMSWLKRIDDPLKLRYSPKSAQWVGKEICACIGTDPHDQQTRAFVLRAIDSWLASGILRKRSILDARQGRNTDVVEVVTEE